ncbi:acyltransferase [Sulfurospirillum barnesii]|uniref:Acyltransferase 3 domain-containing protein n=1 Tax=Sulfurospirillum barnesii (strain ATCC 700032 / DSM 10660 / SES-3) TaxID=760154 RepID=I3XYX4_SULBS|nr:acyltransferase [Sulfurospirillum barnesii]AFL69148.1 hypothetical protein Sulba_1868 [Sulfurospirillum barnesii SES-3]
MKLSYERIKYFDMLRGTAIIFVVIIHSSNKGFQFSSDSFNFNFTVLTRQLINIAVPLFLAISGYFLVQKNISRWGEYFSFIKKQIPKIYIPFLFWSSVFLILEVLIFNQSIASELFKLVVFQSSGPYYFIALIIQYYILLPILKKLANFRGLIISLLISFAVVGITFYIRNYMGIKLPLILYAGNFPVLLVFFVLGLYLGSIKKISISNKLLITLVVTFYILSCLESYFLFSLFRNGGLAATAMKPSSFMFSFFLIILLFKNIDFFKSRTLEYLGKISFGIYLIHVLLLKIIPPLIVKIVPSLIENQLVYQSLLASSVLSFCVLIILISRKIFPKKIIEVLGFK